VKLTEEEVEKLVLPVQLKIVKETEPTASFTLVIASTETYRKKDEDNARKVEKELK
jgi:hypothetical protein